MQGVSTEKVAGGKLLRIKVDFDGNINNIRIEGDFFAHPEDIVEKIENAIKGADAKTGEKDIENTVIGVLSRNEAELVGIDAASIARNIIKAIGEAK